MCPSLLWRLRRRSPSPDTTWSAKCLSRWSNSPVSPITFRASSLKDGLKMAL